MLASVAMGQSAYMESICHPNLMGMGSPCGKVYSLAGVLHMRIEDMMCFRAGLRTNTQPRSDDTLPSYISDNEERAK